MKINESLKLLVTIVSIVVIMFIVIFSTLIPFRKIEGIPFFDKLCHFTAYAIFSFILAVFFRFYTTISNKKLFFSTLIIISLFGGIIEIVQYFLPTRSADFVDFIVNILGGIVGLVLFFVIKYFFV
jgi:VanZ family protein